MLRLISLRMADVSPRSSPLRYVSRGGTSATQRQKFHSDVCVSQCDSTDMGRALIDFEAVLELDETVSSLR